MDIDAGEIHQTILEINEVEDKIHYLISKRDKLKAKLEELQDYDVYFYWDNDKEDKWMMSTEVPDIMYSNVIKMNVIDARKLFRLLHNK